jgi:ubiquinone/menaquinone biosynthesis C-methylase UbiE
VDRSANSSETGSSASGGQDDGIRADYVLGHSDRELERLRRQGALFSDLTRDLLLHAGLKNGMRVLDIGCGVGDVSLIAAELVSQDGAVTGIDPAVEALAIARARLDAYGKTWVRFSQGTLESSEDCSHFDAAIGRFILIHLANPVEALRGLRNRLRPGAIMSFIEFDLSTAAAYPPLPLLQQCIGWVGEVYRRMGRQLDMGVALYSTFRAAGLTPQMAGLTRITSSSDEAGIDFLVESIRSLLPAMMKLGVATEETINIDTLRQRLLQESVSGDHCVFYPRLVGAWATTS